MVMTGWSERDDNHLRLWAKEGVFDYADAARALDRTIGGVRNRCQKIGVTLKHAKMNSSNWSPQDIAALDIPGEVDLDTAVFEDWPAAVADTGTPHAPPRLTEANAVNPRGVPEPEKTPAWGHGADDRNSIDRLKGALGC